MTVNDNRARQMKYAFDRLAAPDLGLVVLPRAGQRRDRYRDLQLLNEGGVQPGGTAPIYKRPTANETTIDIPIAFYLNGWVNVLTDAELAAWLMFRHRYQTALPAAATDGITLGGQVRLARYGLGRTVWDEHKTLSLFGLLRHERDDRRRDDGTVDEYTADGPGRKHRFWVTDGVLDEDARVHVLGKLSGALASPGFRSR